MIELRHMDVCHFVIEECGNLVMITCVCLDE